MNLKPRYALSGRQVSTKNSCQANVDMSRWPIRDPHAPGTESGTIFRSTSRGIVSQNR